MWWTENNRKQKTWPEINTGDFTVTMERHDGHGFWSAVFDADPDLFAKVLMLAEKHTVVHKEFHPEFVSNEVRTTELL